RSIPLFDYYDYVDGIYPGGLIKGIGFELVSLKELRSITSKSKVHQEHVTNWLRENLADSEKRIKLVPDDLKNYREDVFLTCDYPEDLELIQQILDFYNFRIDITTEEVLELLERFPHLKRINKHLHG